MELEDAVQSAVFETDTDTDFKSGVLASSRTNPAEAAESLRISRSSGQPVVGGKMGVESAKMDLIENDVDLWDKPKTRKYMSNPDKASVSSNDVDNLKSFESTVKKHSDGSFLRKLAERHYELTDPNKIFDTINSAGARMTADILSIPPTLEQLWFHPSNLFYKAIGKPEKIYTVPQWKFNTPAIQYYKDMADRFKTDEMEINILDSVSKGDYDEAINGVVYGALAQMPQLIPVFASGGSSATLPFLGLMSGAGAARELSEKGAGGVEIASQALGYGAAEIGGEYIGTLRVIRKMGDRIAKREGKNAAIRVVGGALDVIYGGGIEFAEEGTTEFAQIASDYLNTGDEKIFDDAVSRIIQSAVIGGVTGAGMIVPYAASRAVNDAEYYKKTYDKLGEIVKQSKTNSISKEAFHDFVEMQLEGTELEYVHPSIEKIDAWCESKGINPVEFMASINAADSYKSAKENNVGFVTLKTSDWMSASDAYSEFSKDVKYNPEYKTPNEAQELKKTSDESAKRLQHEEEIRTEVKDKIIKEGGKDLFGTGQEIKRLKEELSREKIRQAEAWAKAHEFERRAKKAERETEEVRRLDPFLEIPGKYAYEKDRKRTEGRVFTRIDIDNFGMVNDKFGHPVGDKVFLKIRDAFVKFAAENKGSVPYRVGGDEFAIISEGTDEETTERLMVEFQERLEKEPFEIETDSGRRFKVNGIGISFGVGVNNETADRMAILQKEQRTREGKRIPKGSPLNTYNRIREILERGEDQEGEALGREGVDRHSLRNEVIAEEKELYGIEAPPDWMSEEATKTWVELREKARDSSEKKLKNIIKDKLSRKRSREYRKKSREAYENIIAELRNYPIYKAIGFITFTPELNLSLSDAQKIFPTESFETAKKMGVFAKEGGLNPNLVAEYVGYENGTALLRDLSTVVPMNEYAKTLAESQVNGELIDDDTLGDESVEAVLKNDYYGKLLQYELEYMLTDGFAEFKKIDHIINRKPPKSDELKQCAVESISNMKIGETRPTLFKNAVQKNFEEAKKHELKGEWGEMFDSLEKRIVNHYMHELSQSAIIGMKKSFRLYRTILKPDVKLAKTRDLDFVYAVRALLKEMGFAKKDVSVYEYLGKIKEYEPEIGGRIIDTIQEPLTRAKNYKDLTWSDFTEINERCVLPLWELSKDLMSIEIENRRLTVEDAVREITAISDKMERPRGLPDTTHATTKFENLNMGFHSMGAAASRVEHWADWYDGINPGKPFRNLAVKPIMKAKDMYMDKKVFYTKKLADIVKKYEHIINRDKIEAFELNDPDHPDRYYTFNGTGELVILIGHMGNDSNTSKLLRGYGWGNIDNQERLNKFLGRMVREGKLVKEHFDMAQEIWNLFEEMKPEAQRTFKKIHGMYFSEVTTREFEAPGGLGRYKGGYIPARVRPDIAINEKLRQERELEEEKSWLFWPSTGEGFTKKRKEGYAKPLSLDFSLLSNHIDSVLRFTYLQPVIRQTSKIVFNKEFQNSIDRVQPGVIQHMLIPWLKRTATQKIYAPASTEVGRIWDDIFRFAKKSTAHQLMMGNLSNTLQQLTGASMVISKFEEKGDMRFLKTAFINVMKDGRALSQFVTDKSSLIRNRTDTSLMDTASEMDNILLNPNLYEKALQFSDRFAYFAQKWAQDIIDKWTWYATYDRSIYQGNAEREAIYDADEMVRLTQGSFSPESVSALEYGTRLGSVFKMFIGFYNMQANSNIYGVRKALRDNGVLRGGARALFITFFGTVLVGQLSALIIRAMANKWDLDDDGDSLDDTMDVLFGETFRMVMNWAPVVGPIATSLVERFTNEKSFRAREDSILTSPVVSLAERAIKAPVSVYKAITGEGKLKNAIRDSFTLASYASGVNIAPLARPLGYAADVYEGYEMPSKYTVPFMDTEIPYSEYIDIGRGLVTGRSSGK